MTQDTQNDLNAYENDLPLTADISEGDEFDGLEAGTAKSSSKSSVIALIAIVLVAGAAFLTYQLFLIPAEEKIIPVQVPEALPVAEVPPAADPAVIAPASDFVDPNAQTPPVTAVTTEIAPDQVVAEALPATPPPAVDPVVTPAPVAETAPTTATPVVDPVVATATPPVEAAPVVAPVDAIPPASPPAAQALPTPPVEQLKPLDAVPVPSPTVAGTPLPTTPPLTPAQQNAANTSLAVQEILGGDAVASSVAQAAVAKEVEVTPRAKQVIFVTKTYSGQSPQAAVAAGDRVMQAGQFGSAAEIYDQQLKKNPSDPMALAGKALALQRAGRNTDAMNTYQRLLDLNPRDIEALTNYLGLLQRENPTQAMSRLQTLSQQYPSNAAVSGQLAMAQARSMDTPNALRSFAKAEALDPTNPTYPFNLGVLYDRLGTTDKAREYYNKTLSLARDYPERSEGVALDTVRNRLASLGN